MLQYLVGGKVDAAQATFSKLYQIRYGTLLTYLYPYTIHLEIIFKTLFILIKMYN